MIDLIYSAAEIVQCIDSVQSIGFNAAFILTGLPFCLIDTVLSPMYIQNIRADNIFTL